MKKGVFCAALAASLVLLFVIASTSPAGSQAAVKPAVETRCTDAGVISASNMEDKLPVSVKKSGGSSREITGTWRDMANGLMKFTSDDMSVVDVRGGYYTVAFGKKSHGVTCPPFKFSCKLINATINGCYKRNDTFFAKYTAYSFRYDKKNEFRFEKPFMLSYAAVANVSGKKKDLTHSPVAVSPGFEEINISRIRRVGSNSYTVKWQTPLDIVKFSARYDDCDTAKYTFYDSFDCTDLPSCQKDGECLKEERCDDSLCVPISCAACQYIANHTCVDYDCCGNDDCDSGLVCGKEKRCEPLACEFNEYVSGHDCEALSCGEDEYVSNHTCSKLNCREDELAANHVCKKIECADNEVISNRSCQRLNCGFMKKAKNHSCISMMSGWFGRKKVTLPA